MNNMGGGGLPGDNDEWSLQVRLMSSVSLCHILYSFSLYDIVARNCSGLGSYFERRDIFSDDRDS